jgi:hypothetical protein
VLGISDFEDSPRVIENAADQRMLHLRTFQLGAHARETQQLLNEISQARVCLLKADSKAAYDEKPHGHLYLGVSGRNNRYEHYRGLLDELTILDREITANEVEAMYREIARTR